MKVYLVSRIQGDYDECHTTIMAIFKYKELAEKYVEKATVLFPKLYDFYYDICFNQPFDHALKNESYSRYSRFEDANFYIEEFELR